MNQLSRRYHLAVALVFISASAAAQEIKSAKELTEKKGLSGIIYRAPIDENGVLVEDKMEAVLVSDEIEAVYEKVKEAKAGEDVLESYFSDDNADKILMTTEADQLDANYEDTFEESELGALKPNGFCHFRRHYYQPCNTIVSFQNSVYQTSVVYPGYWAGNRSWGWSAQVGWGQNYYTPIVNAWPVNNYVIQPQAFGWQTYYNRCFNGYAGWGYSYTSF